MQMAVLRHQAELGRHSDEELVASGAARRRERRFARSSSATTSGCSGWRARVVRNDAEAEDVVQETYVRAFTKLDSFRGDAHARRPGSPGSRLNEALGPRAPAAADRRACRTRYRNGVNEGGRDHVSDLANACQSPKPSLPAARSGNSWKHAVDDLPDAVQDRLHPARHRGDEHRGDGGPALAQARNGEDAAAPGAPVMRAAIEKRLSATFSELFPFDGARCERMADQVVERLRDQGCIER